MPGQATKVPGLNGAHDLLKLTLGVHTRAPNYVNTIVQVSHPETVTHLVQHLGTPVP